MANIVNNRFFINNIILPVDIISKLIPFFIVGDKNLGEVLPKHLKAVIIIDASWSIGIKIN